MSSAELMKLSLTNYFTFCSMAVLLETSLGDLVIDLYTKEAPNTCLNFLKLCTIKYYNNCLFHSVQKDFIAQTGDPTGTGKGGECIWNVTKQQKSRFFKSEIHPKLSHNKIGILSMACFEENKDLLGSQFFITLSADMTRLDKHYTIFGEVAEGFDVLNKINEAFVDNDNRPMRNIRIRHTVLIDDPFENTIVNGLSAIIPEKSPSPQLDQYDFERIRDDEIILAQGQNEIDLKEEIDHLNAKSDAQILVMVDDIPDIDTKPPDNVLFVCRLNAITEDQDLKIIFRQFGKIKSCEIIRDWKTGDSLQYAFIEFEEVNDCQKAYIKMENALIDDRRIHVDFSQSVAKYYWHHKKKGKFDKMKGANHKRVETANKMYNKYKNEDGKGREKKELKFESVGNEKELSENFNKTKLKRKDKHRGRDDKRRYKKVVSKHRKSRSRSRSRSTERYRRKYKYSDRHR